MEANSGLQKMYEYFGIMVDARENIYEREHEYLEILLAVNGSKDERILTSQIITRFFKYFPNHAAQALESLIDLCEDDDICVRKQAIKNLPVLCQGSTNYVFKVANILAQLLKADDPHELITGQNSLMSLFHIDAESTLNGIFVQLESDKQVVRERCMKFILNKVMCLGKLIINKDVEELLIAQCKKAMQIITCEEYETIMTILSSTCLINNPEGRKELVELLAKTAELDQYFDPNNIDQVDRFITCLELAGPFFSTHVETTKFIVYICQLLDRYSLIKDIEKQFIILKALAESAPYWGKLINPKFVIGQLYQALIDLSTGPENNTRKKVEDMDLYHVEALLYTIHKLVKHYPDILSKDNKRLYELKKMLMYFSTCTQTYVEMTRRELNEKADQLNNGPAIEKQIEVLRLACNVNTLLKELLINNPSRCSATISLPWLGRATKSIYALFVREGEKHLPLTVDGTTKRIEQHLWYQSKYKFSAKFANKTSISNNIPYTHRRSYVTGRNSNKTFDTDIGNNRRFSWRPY